MKILTVLALVLLMYQSSSVSRPQCLSCKQTFCYCSRQNLETVPAAPSQPITELDLSFNRLEEIMENDFVAFASLRSLIMNNNRIQKIHEQAFAPLTYLEKLDLSFNRLHSVSAGWFKNLSSLQNLNLLGNEYITLGQGNLFQPLKRLKTLHFGGPYLRSIGKNDFSGLSDLKEFVFDGRNLKVYTEGSLRQIGPVKNATLGLNGPLWKHQVLVEAILSDVVHPNTTLTFTNMLLFTYNNMIPLKVAHSGGTKSIIFKNVTMSVTACLAFLKLMSDSNLTSLAVEDTVLFLSSFGSIENIPHMDHLEALMFKNVNVPEFYSFPALLFLQPVLSMVRKLSLINCKMFLLNCESSVDFTKLEYMDISDNLVTDPALREMMCNGKGVFWSLQTFKVSRNHLQTINSQLFTKLDKLRIIDMSGNVFHRMPDTCYWPPSLQLLNLSSTHLREVTACIPATLHILDLSDNDLTVFNIELPFLTELYISGNKITSLPDGSLYPHLALFLIHDNDLQTFSSYSLNKYNTLKIVEAGADTYVCSCDFLAFMKSGRKDHRVTIGDKFKSYICDSPDAVRGKSAADAELSVFECHTALALSLLLLGILLVLLVIAGLCYKFSVVWYMKMTWAWLKAKRKPKLKKGEIEYDAFVSYSDMDSGWVEAHLIPELEQTEPHLRLCLHKRDFVPGGWIIDNIMDAIEKSHRTLFVLSQHFVRSEWCKYELDYTHFRLFDQNDDSVVLILLEPIDRETVPKKFCKLRRVMNSRTYLEWPDEDDLIPRFWNSLKTAIQRPNTEGTNLLQFDIL